MFLRQIEDHSLAQYAYLIGCQQTGEAVVIDPERDVDRYLRLADENGLSLSAVADTHIHADYLSGARELVERHGLKGYFSSEGGEDWQFEWARELDRVILLEDGDTFRIGNIGIKALLTPGHTPEHLSFLVTDHGGGADEPMALLSGDFIFVGDVGRPDLLESAAGRQDVMKPSARILYDSLRGTKELPGFLQILPAHGAGSACGKALGAVPSSVMDYERLHNAAFRLALEGEREDFVGTILDGQPEPPLYFARMKRDNRAGPALLPDGRLPVPRRLEASGLVEWLKGEGRVALDLRTDRGAFMGKHVKRSLFAPPTGGHFSVVTGSYLEEDARILLLVENEEQVGAAVRDLVRIGLDHVEAWMPVSEALGVDAVTASVRRMSTAELGPKSGASVLDVRGAGEYATGHVKGAVNIAHTRLADRKDEIPADEPIVVHCASGMRASLATAYLASLGREVVHAEEWALRRHSRRNQVMKSWALVGALGLSACSSETKEGVERRPKSEVVAEAETVAKAAFERLSGALGKAMAEGGPTHAIPFCSSKAGSLTSEVADEHGVGLARLSDRPRNPMQRATGEDLAALEAMREEAKPRVAWEEDGTAVVRLPIVINNPVCLSCHGGEEVAEETRRVLSERYPEDEATGYRMNDLRGIWRIELPARP